MALPPYRDLLRRIRKVYPAAELVHPKWELAHWWVVARNGQFGWLSQPKRSMALACQEALNLIEGVNGPKSGGGAHGGGQPGPRDPADRRRPELRPGHVEPGPGASGVAGGVPCGPPGAGGGGPPAGPLADALEDYENPDKIECRIGRTTSSHGPDYYVVELTHRPSKRKLVAELNPNEFAQIITGMGGVYGKFRERFLGQTEKKK